MADEIRWGNVLVKREISAKIRPALTPRRCEVCGKEYTPNRCTQRFCSIDCSNRFHIKRLKAYKGHNHVPMSQQRRICKVCGVEFTPTTGGQKCCSVECSAKNLRLLELARQKGTGGNKGSGRARGSDFGVGAIEKKCEYCGVIFTAFNVRTKFCSDECRYKKDQHEREERYKKAHPVRTCLECGKIFQPTHKDQVCCSQSCRELRQRKWSMGKNHYPTNGVKISEKTSEIVRAKLMEEVAEKNDSVFSYDKLLHMKPNDFRKALDGMNEEERKKFIAWCKNKYQIRIGSKTAFMGDKNNCSNQGFRAKIIDAINGGYLGYFASGSMKSREDRIRKEMAEDAE